MGYRAKVKKARRFLLRRVTNDMPPDSDAPIVARVAAKLERRRGAR